MAQEFRTRTVRCIHQPVFAIGQRAAISQQVRKEEILGDLTLYENHRQIVNWTCQNDHPYAHHLCRNMLFGWFHEILEQEDEETDTERGTEEEDTSEDSEETLLDPFHCLQPVGGCNVCGHLLVRGSGKGQEVFLCCPH